MEVKNNELIFAKVKPNAIIPTKEEENGWYDVYACIDEPVIIESNKIALIPTGIATAVTPEYKINVAERGSNTKSHLIVMAGRIDSGYRGEWFIALYNGYDKPVVLMNEIDKYIDAKDVLLVPTKKAIAQFSVDYVPKMKEMEVSYEELMSISSKRGTGKLGSSGK